jgi:hypothetical protein
MTTPISRARTTLRAIHRFKAGLRRDIEAGVPGAQEAAAEVNVSQSSAPDRRSVSPGMV